MLNIEQTSILKLYLKLIKRQYKFLISLLISFLLIVLPIEILAMSNSDSGSDSAKIYVSSTYLIFTTLWTMIISFMLLETTQDRIYNSSLPKRLSTTISVKNYLLIIFMTFFCTSMIWSMSTFLIQALLFIIVGAPAMEEVSFLYFVIFSIVTNAFIIMLALWISSWKTNSIFKGILSMVFIILFYFFSFFFLEKDIFLELDENLKWIIIFNPFSLLVILNHSLVSFEIIHGIDFIIMITYFILLLFLISFLTYRKYVKLWTYE